MGCHLWGCKARWKRGGRTDGELEPYGRGGILPRVHGSRPGTFGAREPTDPVSLLSGTEPPLKRRPPVPPPPVWCSPLREGAARCGTGCPVHTFGTVKRGSAMIALLPSNLLAASEVPGTHDGQGDGKASRRASGARRASIHTLRGDQLDRCGLPRNRLRRAVRRRQRVGWGSVHRDTPLVLQGRPVHRDGPVVVTDEDVKTRTACGASAAR